ncbi:MAG TPA: hypothetical protein VEG37_01950 [Burkholderiales bacterium]|nr:hypothetical protein [Burkholderiales bacterium]
MLKVYLAALLLGISVSAVAGKYTSPSMGNVSSPPGSSPADSHAGAAGPQPAGGNAGNGGEEPISDQVIEDHRIGGTAAELDRKRHEREATCAAEAKQHKYDPDCD